MLHNFENLLKVITILLLLICRFSFQQQPDQCYEGVQSRKGNFWYVCRQGREVPVSCIAPDGRTQFAVGQTFKTEHFIIQCLQPTANSIQLAPVACISPKTGHTISPGNLFTPDQTFYFRCVQNFQDNSLQTQLAGCVGPTGELVGDQGLIRRGQFLYKCRFVNQNTIRLEAYACTYDNRQYYPGQDILTQAVWYRCETDPGGGIGIKLKGCIKQGQRHEVDKRFNDGNFVFKCTVEGNRIFPMAIGCMERFRNGTLSEFDPGEKWLAEMADYNRYLIECQRQGSWLQRAAIQCYYNTLEGFGYLDAGCMRRVGRRLIQCMGPSQQSPNVRMRIQEPFDEASVQRLINEGMRLC